MFVALSINLLFKSRKKIIDRILEENNLNFVIKFASVDVNTKSIKKKIHDVK